MWPLLTRKPDWEYLESFLEQAFLIFPNKRPDSEPDPLLSVAPGSFQPESLIGNTWKAHSPATLKQRVWQAELIIHRAKLVALFSQGTWA